MFIKNITRKGQLNKSAWIYFEIVHCMKKKFQDLDLIFAMQQFFWLLNQLPRPPTCTFESSVFFGKVPISLLKNSFRYSEIKEFKISEFREKLLLVFQYYFKREEKWCWKQQTENREILAQQIFHLLENYV